MFGRRRPRGDEPREPEGIDPDAAGPRHPDLTALSVAQSDALHDLVLAALAARGEPAETAGDGVIRSEHMTYGLHNLSLIVASAPRSDWPAIVTEHLARVGPRDDADDEPVSDDMLLLKLRDGTDVDGDALFAEVSPFPGLLVLPAIDFPEYVRELLSPDKLAAFGGWERFRETAAANLRRLPSPDHQALDTADGDADAVVHVFVTDDFFGAARVLVLDHLLASQLGIERPAHGCLVAVPNRHLLAVHVLTGAGVVSALDTLVRLAEGEHRDKPGPISPEVFFVPATGGRAQQLTRHEPGEPTAVVIDGGFEAAMTSLGLLGGDG